MSAQGADNGEKIIAASKRPDGTYRKERRVRAGYIPQDEQPVYQSKGALFKQNVPKCPGLDEAEAIQKPLTKSARKNAKRKEKKESESSVDDAAQAINGLSVSEALNMPDFPPGLIGNQQHSAQTASTSSTANGSFNANGTSAATSTSAADVLHNSGAAAPAAPQDVEKQLRNLRKKIRQADATAKKAAQGMQLTPEEEEKLEKLKVWQAEEAKLAA